MNVTAHEQAIWDAHVDLTTAARARIRELETALRETAEALEEISGGVGCDSKYGPGCDINCKKIAGRAFEAARKVLGK